MSDSTRRFHRPTNPHFFQPLIPGFETNFSIPKSFRKYVDMVGQDDNGIAITLRDRRRKIWKLKVVEGDDYRQCFKDGWDVFCKDNALQVGDLLVFRHQGNLVFDVFIFDPPTACERGFPFLDGEPQEKMEASSSKSTRIVTVAAQSEGKGLKRKMGGKEHPKTQVAFKPTGRPYFHTVLKPYNARCGAITIPVDFARKHGLTERRCEMVLKDANGQSWSMQLRHRSACTNAAYMTGWRRFHIANGLCIGDSVIFELITSERKPVMKFYACKQGIPVLNSRAEVTALCLNPGDSIADNGKGIRVQCSTHPSFKEEHGNTNRIMCSPQAKRTQNTSNTENKQNKTRESERRSKDCLKQRVAFEPTKYPYWCTVVKQYWLRSSTMYFSKDFARKNGLSKRRCTIVVIDKKGRRWSLRLSHHGHSPSYITHWRPFHHANALKTGDLVVFELIHSGKNPVVKCYS